ncbi:MAG: DUF1993 domain-containing protein [Gammaproteobacteria bacterium]|nr:DUF1993 domain-containing protein [Gammaproteobacteria bacterium]
MSISLYDLSVGTYLQVVGSTAAFLEKGAAHCVEHEIALDDVVGTSLYPDMSSFHFQAVSVAHHSMGAIKGMLAGEFAPPTGYPETDFGGLQGLINNTLDELKALDADTVNALSGGSIVFKLGENRIPFTNENFVMSFSLPNLFFHATTAYDILRMTGVPIGKRDFLGQMRMGV